MLRRFVMARIIHCHPSRTRYDYHIYTDLDFWDARRILKDLALVKRNFGADPSGDDFPAQVVGLGLLPSDTRKIEKRLKKAVASPPRHVIVRSMLSEGAFEFDPFQYYPARWTPSRMLYFTFHRLPLEQAALSTAYQTVSLGWVQNKIRVERVQRKEKYDPVIRSKEEATRRLMVPACF
jgi:hypothetical protein